MYIYIYIYDLFWTSHISSENIFSKQIIDFLWNAHIFEWENNIFDVNNYLHWEKSCFRGNKHVSQQLYNIYVYVYDHKLSNRTLGPTFECQSVSTITQPFQTRTDISAQRLKFPGISPSLAGSRARKEQLKKQNMIGYAAYEW